VVRNQITLSNLLLRRSSTWTWWCSSKELESSKQMEDNYSHQHSKSSKKSKLYHHPCVHLIWMPNHNSSYNKSSNHNISNQFHSFSHSDSSSKVSWQSSRRYIRNCNNSNNSNNSSSSSSSSKPFSCNHRHNLDHFA